MNQKVIEPVILEFQPSDKEKGRCDYKLNGVFFGNDVNGFKRCLDTLKRRKNISNIIIKVPLASGVNSSSLKESLPFYNYRVGYDSLIELCNKKGISLKYEFI